jgi:molybdate transport system regulatory protein
MPYDDVMQPRAKLWIERDGRLALSDFRVELLEHLEASGSLADAAAQMGLSYRRAWGKLREIEQNLGVKLVESTAGGAGGGGSRLTARGRELVALYRRFREAMGDDLEREFQRIFGPASR